MKTTTKRRTFRTPKHPQLFDALGTQRIGRTVCFLCGTSLTKHNRSDEHVFPKWLQHRYGLWNLELTLLNGTSIPYRSLTIPCCRMCNSKHLAPLEDKVRRAVQKGPAAVRKLSKRILFHWLSKILYGILYKEGLLSADRRNPSAERLVPRPLLESLHTHHMFLQGVRVPMVFNDFFPASIFVYRIAKPTDSRFHFNFRDFPEVLGISLQMGSVGVIALLQDGGTHETGFATHLDAYKRHPLHPLQFLELIAKIFYKATLFNRTPKYMTMEGVRALQVIQLPIGGFSSLPLYNDWDWETYAKYLGFHTRFSLEQIYSPPDRVITWLNGPDGEPRQLSLKSNPWPEHERSLK